MCKLILYLNVHEFATKFVWRQNWNSRNVWWWQSNRGLCSTMWSGCWGKLTGNSIIGRLPPLNGNGDDDGYTSPHHNNGFTPPLRLGNWADPHPPPPPSGGPHVEPLFIFICNLPRNQIIEPIQLNYILFVVKVRAYLIIVTDATDAVSVNFSGRCKFLLI